ncbi:MAG: hypothetical protein ACM3MA_02405 [Acidobacteriota bacterium]
MALIKIYTEEKNVDELRAHVARSVKLIGAAALNVPGVETTPGSVETVRGEGIDLIGIDYICEIIAVKRIGEQAIADSFIHGLGQVYPDKLFSVYFVHIDKEGMSNTPREHTKSEPIDMATAVLRAREVAE